MNSDQEQLLITKAKAGDKGALGALWDEITPKLFGYLINTVRDKTLAEDLLQSTWLKAIQALPRFEQRGINFSAWLFAIARNECRQYWRKTKPEEPLNENLHDKPVQQATQTEQKILAEQLLNKLSETDRELLRLRYIADLSIKDMAKVLNINSIAIRVRLHRALLRAREGINS